MAIQTTTWKPDTCDCKINYTWDDAVPEKERTFSVGEGTKKCAAHSSYKNDADLFAAVLEENTSKNIALAEIAKAIEKFAIPLDEYDESAGVSPDLSMMRFHVNEDRKIEIILKKATEKDKLAAANALAAKGRLSKVVIK